MVEKTQTKVGLKFEFPTSMPKPNPVHLSFSEGNFGSCISSNSCAFCLTPNADCIERTRDMSSTNWFINSSIEPHSPTWIPSTPIRAYIEAWALELLANARKELCHVRLESLDGIIGMGAVSWFGKDLVGSMLCNWVLKVLFSIDGFMR